MKYTCFLLASAMMLLSACSNEETAGGPASSPQLETQTPAAESNDVPEVVTKAEAPPQEDGGYSTSIILTDPDGVQQITWEDLMPDGEEEILAQLYEEYFTQLERDMRARSQRLQDAGRESVGDDAVDITAMIAEGSAADTMDQVGTFNVVEDLDGLQIRIPGYVVPLDFNADNEYTEFLLVPYFGACLHTPPPPPNQIVYVTSDPAAKVESIYDPVWVEGTMKTGRFDTDTANSAYELTLSKIEIYEY